MKKLLSSILTLIFLTNFSYSQINDGDQVCAIVSSTGQTFCSNVDNSILLTICEGDELCFPMPKADAINTWDILTGSSCSTPIVQLGANTFCCTYNTPGTFDLHYIKVQYDDSNYTNPIETIPSPLVHVVVLPRPILVMYPPQTICSGQSAIIGATGASTYLWNNGNTSPNFNVSPTTTTTYTVTGTTNGCTATGTMTVTVIPSPTVTVNSPSFCSIQPATLIANGATSYLWSNGQTINPITVNPTSTTSYTVTGTTNGCTNSAVATVSINSIPNVTVNSPSICNGTSATLTASGATSYSWSSGQTTNPIFVSPATTTSYTVTGTLNGCTNSAVSTVTVNSITATASASPSSIAAGQSSNLNAVPTGGTGYTYSWIPSGSLSNSTIQNPVATPTVTTTYTVTVTDSRGCTTTATTTVTILPPSQCAVTLNRDIASGTFLSSLWPANTMVSGQNIRITGTVYADVNLTFANCNIIMQPNAKIQLQNSTILKLTEKTHVYSCTDMWDGIYSSSPTQKIIVEQNAFVEDGLNAIVSENGGQYDISTSIFNKNLIAIDIRTFNNNSGTNYPGVIRKNVFTSRAIPSNAVPSSNAGMATVLSNINSYPAANTKAPYPIQKGAYGVNITDVNGSFGVNIGFGGLMPDGTSAVNTFEGIMVGVNVVRSTVKIYNNSFVNLLNPNLCIGCYNVKGYGVKATGTSTGNYSIVVGFSGQYNNNTFNNCYRAVETYEYKNVDIGYNIINNSITASGSTPGYGNGGILVMKPASASSINVLQNNINNCSFAIWLGFAYSSYTIDTYSMQVNGNTISANSNGYCTNGVYINALSSATINTPATSEIMDNIITEATNGISISNFKKIINIKENSITTRYASTGNTNGIKLVGCQNLVVENNHTKYNNVGGLELQEKSGQLIFSIKPHFLS